MRGRRPLGDLVASGNTSDVWWWSRRTVVKVLRPGIPTQWAALEADITNRVYQAGLPAPATDGVVEVDGRPGIVFEHIDGPSMWNRMKATPSEQPRLVEGLVDLQEALHATGTVEGLPDLVSRVHSKIELAATLSANDKAEALALLEAMPTGAALCHGDMHPANVLMSARGMVVIDWFDAAVGHRVADLARSSLLMRPPQSRGSTCTFLTGAKRSFLHRLHVAYLAAIERRGLVQGTPFDEWEAVLAAARMSEPVPTADLIRIWRNWHDSAHPTPGRRRELIAAAPQADGRA